MTEHRLFPYFLILATGPIWGIIIFSEQHSLWVWISVIVTLLGLLLVNPDDDSPEVDQAIAETSGSRVI